jgi:nucleoside-diphosphate-sugar epimerase
MQRGSPGESYIIAGPPHTLVDALRIAQSVTGVKRMPMVVPPQVLKGGAAVLGALEGLPFWPGMPAESTAEYLRVAAGVTYWGSNAKARSALGFEPRPLDEGLRQVLAEELRRLS